MSYAATEPTTDTSPISPWWRQAVILVMILGFTLLTIVTVKTYSGAPPIPAQVVDEAGRVVFLEADVNKGQEVFFKYGLMEHGTLWGHGAYLGPDYTAEYLHRLAEIAQDTEANRLFGKPVAQLTRGQASEVVDAVKRLLKQNRYDATTRTLTFTEAERASFDRQKGEWQAYFGGATGAPGLPAKFIKSEQELAALNAYFAWATWATVALRPGTGYSYTNNWPYEPLVGNTPTSSAFLWSGLSLVSLLGGLGLVLFIFGKFNFLGWSGGEGRTSGFTGTLRDWVLTPSQKALALFFAVV
ncbi:MAG TPA: hypothetical protein VF378_09975, partial [Geothrix sp.]